MMNDQQPQKTWFARQWHWVVGGAALLFCFCAGFPVLAVLALRVNSPEPGVGSYRELRDNNRPKPPAPATRTGKLSCENTWRQSIDSTRKPPGSVALDGGLNALFAVQDRIAHKFYEGEDDSVLNQDEMDLYVYHVKNPTHTR